MALGGRDTRGMDAMLEEGSSAGLPSCPEQEALCGAEGKQLRAMEAAEAPLCPPMLRSVKSNRGLVPAQWRRIGMATAAGLVALVLLACAALAASSGAAPPQQQRKASRPMGLASEQMEPWPASPSRSQVPWPTSCVYGETPVCPARALFKNPEVHAVAAENLLRAGGEEYVDARDREMVRAAVEKGFVSIDAEIERRRPEVAKELDLVPLTEPQKDAVLGSMRLMSDPRVQNIGFDVAQAIRDSASPEPAVLRAAVEERLRPRLEEIRALRAELMPEALRDAWATGHQWNMTLDPANIRIMQSTKGGILKDTFSAQQSSSMGQAGRAVLSAEEKSYGILGGVLEEGRALVDIIQMCARLFGKDLELPASATAIPGTYYFSSGVISCEVSSAEDSGLSFMKAFFCPLKFGAQGIDALRAEPSMSGRATA